MGQCYLVFFAGIRVSSKMFLLHFEAIGFPFCDIDSWCRRPGSKIWNSWTLFVFEIISRDLLSGTVVAGAPFCTVPYGANNTYRLSRETILVTGT